MDDIPKEWVDLVEHLRGSCTTLSSAFETFGLDDSLEVDKRFCAYLDSELMLCNTCEWWAEAHEIDDAGNCEDCSDGEDD